RAEATAEPALGAAAARASRPSGGASRSAARPPPRAHGSARAPRSSLRGRALLWRAGAHPRHLDQHREEPTPAGQGPAAGGADEGRSGMKRDSVDESLMRYFAPATDASHLAGRGPSAARGPARADGPAPVVPPHPRPH